MAEKGLQLLSLSMFLQHEMHLQQHITAKFCLLAEVKRTKELNKKEIISIQNTIRIFRIIVNKLKIHIV